MAQASYHCPHPLQHVNIFAFFVAVFIVLCFVVFRPNQRPLKKKISPDEFSGNLEMLAYFFLGHPWT